MADQPGPSLTLDQIEATVRKVLGRAPRPEPDGEDEAPRGGSAEAKIARLVAENKQLKAHVAEVGTAFEDYKKGAQAEIGRTKESAAGEVAGLAQRHADDLTLAGHGITDPLGRDAVRRAFDMTPKEGRPKTVGDWWGSQVAAHKAAGADPKLTPPEVPVTLRGYLPPIEAPKPAAGKPGAANGQQQRSQWGGRGVDAGTGPAAGPKGLKEALDSATDLDSMFKNLGALPPGTA